jgi:hypothetical protein
VPRSLAHIRSNAHYDLLDYKGCMGFKSRHWRKTYAARQERRHIKMVDLLADERGDEPVEESNLDYLGALYRDDDRPYDSDFTSWERLCSLIHNPQTGASA